MIICLGGKCKFKCSKCTSRILRYVHAEDYWKLSTLTVSLTTPLGLVGKFCFITLVHMNGCVILDPRGNLSHSLRKYLCFFFFFLHIQPIALNIWETNSYQLQATVVDVNVVSFPEPKSPNFSLLKATGQGLESFLGQLIRQSSVSILRRNLYCNNFKGG